MTDPLEEIFTNEKEIDPQLLVYILKPYVRINVDTNAVFYTDSGSSLQILNKIILFLVARKALKFKDRIEDEAVSPAEIISETGLKDGSVHPTLKSLREQGLVIVKSSKYFIPNYQLNRIKNLFNLKGDKNGD